MSTITLRIPDSKHERLKQYAKDQGLSLNKLFEEKEKKKKGSGDANVIIRQSFL